LALKSGAGSLMRGMGGVVIVSVMMASLIG